MSFILKNKFALLCNKIVSVNSSAAQICGHFASKPNGIDHFVVEKGNFSLLLKLFLKKQIP